MPRPNLTRTLSCAEFQAHYWLKSELTDFCRAHGLSASGGKLELAARIAHWLETGEVKFEPSPRRPKRATIIGELKPESVIPEGCTASQRLRAYFELELGKEFHFNRFMREFLRDNPGKTLQDAADAWREDQAHGPQKREIDPQFEFNRHIRAYFEQHPDATRAEALAAWKRTRLRPE